MSTKAAPSPGTPRLKGNYFTRLLQQYWRCRYLVLLLIPSVVVLIIFKYVPMYGVQIAFKDFKLGKGIVGSAWANPFWAVFQDIFQQPGETGDRAGGRRKQLDEQTGQGDPGDEVGQVGKGLHHFLVAFMAQLVEQQRQDDGHREADDQVHRAQDQGVPEGVPEDRILKDVLED